MKPPGSPLDATPLITLAATAKSPHSPPSLLQLLFPAFAPRGRAVQQHRELRASLGLCPGRMGGGNQCHMQEG